MYHRYHQSLEVDVWLRMPSTARSFRRMSWRRGLRGRDEHKPLLLYNRQTLELVLSLGQFLGSKCGWPVVTTTIWPQNGVLHKSFVTLSHAIRRVEKCPNVTLVVPKKRWEGFYASLSPATSIVLEMDLWRKIKLFIIHVCWHDLAVILFMWECETT